MSRREQEVRGYATELLGDLGLSTPPIDPEWVASEVELSVKEKPLSPGVFGALWKKGNSFGIFVSDSCPTIGHRRFSVAHELGTITLTGTSRPCSSGMLKSWNRQVDCSESEMTAMSVKQTGLLQNSWYLPTRSCRGSVASKRASR